MEIHIETYCHIKNNLVYLNGQCIYELSVSEDPVICLGELYKALALNYPKFFKMDKQCKLGLLAAELVLRNSKDFDQADKSQVGLIFSNHASSIESDRNHARAIQDKNNYFPSPAVFVYTLPNIVIGEIAIKHKLTGENAFFVSDKFEAATLHSYATILFQNHLTQNLLCGWVNLEGSDCEAFVYWLKNSNFKDANPVSGIRHTVEMIEHLYAI